MTNESKPVHLTSHNLKNINSGMHRRRNQCEECGECILDLYHFVIASKFYWHIGCLKCNICGCNLKSKCFIDNGKCYCSEDYFRMNENQFELNKNKFIQTCCKGCYNQLNSNDYVIRLNESYLYHLNCFKCVKCSVNILPGKKYGLINDNLYCDEHYACCIVNENIIKTEPSSEFIFNDDETLRSYSSKILETNYLAKFTCSESSSSTGSPNYEDFKEKKDIRLENNHFSLQNNDDYSDNRNQNLIESETNSHESYLNQEECMDHHLKCSERSSSVNSKQRFLIETTTNVQNSQSIYLKSIEAASAHLDTISAVVETNWTKRNQSSEEPNKIKAKTGSSKQLVESVYGEKWSASKALQVNMQNSMQKKKRMRTSFKHQQLRIMKAYFQLNQNPDSKELKELSERTNLTKRTLQVWFQNSRAKMRKTSTNGHNITNNTRGHEKSSKHSKRLENCEKKETICFEYDYDYQEENEDQDNGGEGSDEDDVDEDDDENNENQDKQLDTLSINNLCVYKVGTETSENNIDSDIYNNTNKNSNNISQYYY